MRLQRQLHALIFYFVYCVVGCSHSLPYMGPENAKFRTFRIFFFQFSPAAG